MYFSISISPQSPHAGETPAPHSNGCARLRRTYQQRLLQVRAPPARRRARRPRTQDSTPLPRRGFPVLSEGFRPQSPHAGETPAPHSNGCARLRRAGGRDARAPRTRRPCPAGASQCSARASARSLRTQARRPRPIQMGARASGAQAGETPALPGLDALAPPGLPGAQRGLMVFSSPRRRASPWLAEGFSPTARGV